MKTSPVLRIVLTSLFIYLFTPAVNGQIADSLQLANKIEDSMYIHEVEQRKEPEKVLHAEPLFIDLIRDLGARKGENEWNIGLGLTDNMDFDEYTALVEYEFAPVNRLGLELELPFSFYYRTSESAGRDSIPQSRLNSIKAAAQYSVFVSEQLKMTMALGYIHELELAPFRQYSKAAVIKGNVYNPFFIVAKRWRNNFHTLVYTGPHISHHFSDQSTHTAWQINSSFHYMIPGTRNFIGIEYNKELEKRSFDMTIRPQLRLGIADNVLIGIVAGIPISREKERFSTFMRLIYEPRHRH